ncbi:MAG: efflux RND transporter permease subunit [Bradyrhizobium sp.]|nr:efflux RND transporter permease subunit [Bradyrhizobium sp.]
MITLIWQYTGLIPEEMEQRVSSYREYSISSSVNHARNIESQTPSVISVEEIYFQPNVNVDLAMSQIVSASNFVRNLMPQGIQHLRWCSTMPPCAGPATQPELRSPQRATTLRLWHLSHRQ